MSGETGHHKVKIAAEIGLSAAVVAGAGYMAVRKYRLDQQRKLDPLRASHYEEKLQIFNKEAPVLPFAHRQAMAEIAARIFVAREYAAEPIVTRTELLAQIEDHYGEAPLSRSTFDKLAGFLKDHEIIERRHKISDPRSHGYAALPALEWGLMHSEHPPELLEQALYRIIRHEQY